MRDGDGKNKKTAEAPLKERPQGFYIFIFVLYLQEDSLLPLSLEEDHF